MALLATNNSLSDAGSQVSNQRLAEYVQKLQAQEGGSDPGKHKINGNMAWWEREQPSDHPMNKYFDSLGRDGQKVLADLKAKVPAAFNSISADQTPDMGKDDNAGTTPDTTQPAPTQPANTQSGFVSKIMNTDPKVWYVVGGGAATLTLIAILAK